jgi:hypothetical protein
MAKSLQQTVDNFKNSGARASADWAAGANAFQGDPTALAAAAGQTAVMNYTNAWTSGRVAAGLARAGRQGWITGINNGQQAYQTGIANAGPKYQAKMQIWLPIIDGAAQQVRAMPSGSLAASQARASRFMQILYDAKHTQGV